jgi:hypothetical protein
MNRFGECASESHRHGIVRGASGVGRPAFPFGQHHLSGLLLRHGVTAGGLSREPVTTAWHQRACGTPGPFWRWCSADYVFSQRLLERGDERFHTASTAIASVTAGDVEGSRLMTGGALPGPPHLPRTASPGLSMARWEIGPYGASLRQCRTRGPQRRLRSWATKFVFRSPVVILGCISILGRFAQHEHCVIQQRRAPTPRPPASSSSVRFPRPSGISPGSTRQAVSDGSSTYFSDIVGGSGGSKLGRHAHSSSIGSGSLPRSSAKDLM